MATKLDYAKMSAHVYDGKTGDRIGQWEMVCSISDENSGFKVGVYVNEETKEVVVSYAGTELGEIKSEIKYVDDENITASLSHPDLENDWQLGRKKVPDQTDNARTFYDETVKKYASQGYEISVTGHSLGGVLAYIIASENNCHGETFNNPGTVGLKYEDGRTVGKAENVTENLSAGDWVSEYGTHGGKVEKTDFSSFLSSIVSGSSLFALLKNELYLHGIDQWVEYLKNDNNTLTLDAESLKPYLDAYTAMQTGLRLHSLPTFQNSKPLNFEK